MTAALTVVAIWSAAEAAIFFLVADIPISWIAVRSGTRPALIAAMVAAVASVAGVLAVLLWAAQDPSGAASAMTALPAIDQGLIASAADIYRHGPIAMLAGAFSGTPFKLFALEAAKQQDFGLMLVAPLLRLPRFVAVALMVGGISKLLSRRLTMRQRLGVLVALWTAFYAFYFAVMPG